MIRLLRSSAVLVALTLPVIAAHADTFGGTAAFTDTSSNTNNDFNFTGNFATSPFSFTGGVGHIYTDTLTLVVGDANCTRRSPCGTSATDALSVTVDFTNPNVQNSGFTGTGDDYSTFYGFVQDQDIVWTSNIQHVTFADGSSVSISLPNFTATESYFGNSTSEDLTITVLSGPTAAPEPSSLMLLGTGVLGAAGMIRRKLTV